MCNTAAVWYGCWFSSRGDSRARYNPMEPIPLQVEHLAIKFVMVPFCPSGPSLWTMKTSVQWCCADTSYFTHNWETCGGWKHLIPSHTGPKDLPLHGTSHGFGNQETNKPSSNLVAANLPWTLGSGTQPSHCPAYCQTCWAPPCAKSHTSRSPWTEPVTTKFLECEL